MRPMNPAPPGEWDPYYNGEEWLREWLRESGRPDIRIPVMPTMRWTAAPELFSAEPPAVLTMTKRKAYGPAPYVGRPFVYVWHVGVDNLGRQIAGESQIVYTDPEPW